LGQARAVRASSGYGFHIDLHLTTVPPLIHKQACWRIFE